MRAMTMVEKIEREMCTCPLTPQKLKHFVQNVFGGGENIEEKKGQRKSHRTVSQLSCSKSLVHGLYAGVTGEHEKRDERGKRG